MKGFIAILIFLCLGVISAIYIGFGTGASTEPKAVDHEMEGLNEKYVLKFSHVVAENTPKGLAAAMFAKLVREKTDGWVEVQVFPNGVLYDAQEEFEALQENDVHIISPAFSEVTVHDPNWMVMDLPFVFEDETEVKEAFEGKLGRKLFESIERRGYKALAYWDNGFKQFTNRIRPIVKPWDVEGIAVRVMPSDVLMDTYEHLGAKPSTHSFNDVYGVLSSGKIDGTENTFSNIYSKGFYKQQEYMTVTNHNYLGYAVLMNSEYWDALPLDHQKNIEEAMAEVTKWLREYAQSHNQEMLEKLVDSNVLEIHFLSEEEKDVWREELVPVYQKYSDFIGDGLVDELLEKDEGDME
ncbi:C4-dicarboxylate ABC transporter [Bacillus sp. LL01]|uniref:DctP family TRAP transporter solute-binding subunit n=1 Tax=Bacillus sp. LL01 TaxID=1665556 RepID=UPI00064D1342|nr:DctP family TRAP transporter solute-binding subunit [Bacillus sp. LL01]KMJ57755.1 C4-dicarboxylate ABC transporter [Bacillus sp. LL01]